ncbi:competence protein ComA [Mannheimia sp. AT1]|uniref:Competence protein ComA n=1 Tax=Mannheimia cairinae TaxID=3025936 RepID=A0ABT5MVW4_9PAST|nr:competence protein ComA [Mannheimia cairinae]MDD0825052.1 competence protein ComA [Mannheimia cairinae]MDD0825693.1 competence protein ComA [Mannheimia cairinae]
MKRFKKQALEAEKIILGLSEDSLTYCLVKRKSEEFTVFWQKKPYDLEQLIYQAIAEDLALENISLLTQKAKQDIWHKLTLIRSVSYEYIWRKTVFLPIALDKVQLHQKIIHIVKNEQPLDIELLNIDYQKSPSTNSSLAKVSIYALRKSYADKLCQYPCILDCELYCYLRAIIHFKNLIPQSIKEFPHFYFKNKVIQFTDTEIHISQDSSESVVYLQDIPTSDPSINSESKKQLYLLALGATLWNGKALT